MRTLADLYQEYVVELDPILWEMGRVNGVPVDNEARLELLSELNGKVANLRKEAQQHVPKSLYPVVHRIEEPSDEYRKKNEVIDVVPVQVANEKVKTCSRCRLQHVTKTEHTGRKGGRGDIPLNECYKADIVLSPGFDTEYDAILPFNPGSDDQLREYASLYRHRLGRNWKTGEDTLDEKQVLKFIDRYGEKHPIYKIAYDTRKIRKSRGYAKAWVPDEKGLIYGHFKHVPETFRLSQAEHNFMNVSHRGNVPYAEELRSLLVAPPGYLIMEADSASVEAVFTGHFMGSTSYMEMARRGIHAAWLLTGLGLDASATNIKKAKKPDEFDGFEEFWAAVGQTAKTVQIRYETKKRTVHGVSYGMGAKLLHESYPEYFPASWVVENGKKKLCATCTAQAEIDDFMKFVPDLKAWQTDTMKWAHKHGYLQSPWGFRNYYYRVFTYDWKDEKWRMGDDAKATVAFQPQHANGMFQRENLKLIHQGVEKRGMRGRWWQPAIGHVHDSNGLMIPEDDVDKAADLFQEVMNRRIKQLGGIQVGVEIKAGKNWNKMKTVRVVA